MVTPIEAALKGRFVGKVGIDLSADLSCRGPEFMHNGLGAWQDNPGITTRATTLLRTPGKNWKTIRHRRACPPHNQHGEAEREHGIALVDGPVDPWAISFWAKFSSEPEIRS